MQNHCVTLSAIHRVETCNQFLSQCAQYSSHDLLQQLCSDVFIGAYVVFDFFRLILCNAINTVTMIRLLLTRYSVSACVTCFPYNLITINNS
jgi:hypothetical protein